MELAIALGVGVVLAFSRIVGWTNGRRESSEPTWVTHETEWRECPACEGTGGTRGKYTLCCLSCMGAGGALVVLGKRPRR